MVFWYSAPLNDDDKSVPITGLHTYEWRNSNVLNCGDKQHEIKKRYGVEDIVFVKPAQARRTTRRPVDHVTVVPSTTCVEIKGI